MNIVLIGYRCAGKTSVGRLLADRLKRKFVDTDAEVAEEAGLSIEDIVSEQGWPGFREIEKSVVETVSSKDGLVIATGGGVVMDSDNVRRLRANGIFFWLNADPTVLKERMARDTRSGRSRPGLTGEGALTEVESVLEARRPHYERASDITVDAGARDILDVADAVLSSLGTAEMKRRT